MGGLSAQDGPVDTRKRTLVQGPGPRETTGILGRWHIHMDSQREDGAGVLALCAAACHTASIDDALQGGISVTLQAGLRRWELPLPFSMLCISRILILREDAIG